MKENQSLNKFIFNHYGNNDNFDYSVERINEVLKIRKRKLTIIFHLELKNRKLKFLRRKEVLIDLAKKIL